MKGKIDKNKSATRILFGGALILVVCIFMCILHINNLQEAFDRNDKEIFRLELGKLNQVLNTEFEQDRQNLSEAAEELGPQLEKGTDIEKYLQACGEGNEYADIGYLSMDRTLLMLGGRSDDAYEKELREKIINKDYPSIRVMSRIIDGSEQDVVLLVEPVRVNDTVKGYLFVEKEVKDILRAGELRMLGEESTGFLIDEEGKILSRSDNDNGWIGDHDKIGKALLELAADRKSEILKIQNLMNTIITQQEGSVEFLDRNGDKQNVVFRKVDMTDNLYLLCFYSSSAVEKRVEDVIFKSVLTCITIAISLIGLTLFVWSSTRKASITIQKLAYEDDVTGGKNLNYFKDHAMEVMAAAKETPFLIQRFDIANFRYLNEAYGHNRADQLLTACIQLSKQHFLEKEICVRMNADQFLILAVNDSRVDQRREDYIKALNEYANSIGIRYPIRLKFGIYQVRKHDTDIEVMIDRANVARKSLKGKEKDLRAYYSDTLVQEMRKLDKVESEMQAALDNGEFRIYLQAKWDIQNDCISGGEALVRWVKPDGTVIPPDSFIPIFERNGFIEKLDLYMLESVCRRARWLLDTGRKIYPVSVNQSRILLYNPEYVKKISKILKEYAIPTKFIELEVTETIFSNERQKMIEVMNKIRSRDLHIAMDDFGSGYSSLNMLKDVTFDTLKIDREFFSESITTESSRWILQKIIEMAEGLGTRVVCEGVETKEQVDILRSLGCRYVQGYYYSRPMPEEEFIQKYCEIDGES